MRAVKASDINDNESFDFWLWGQSIFLQREIAVAIASRCALRLLPILSRKGTLETSHLESVLRSALWGNIIVRASRSWPVGALGSACFAVDKSIALFGFSVENYPALATTVNAIHVANSVSLDLSLETCGFAIDNAASAIEEITSDRNNTVFWENVREDAGVLEKEHNPFELYNHPLWRNQPNWWSDEIFDWIIQFGEKEFSENNWNIWLKWYDSVALGKPAFGLIRKAGDALERAIALGGRDGKFHPEFWDREPGEINAEIAEWVAEARAAEALAAEQVSGLRFQYRNGLIALGNYLGLASPNDDRKRIESNLPQLADLADVLQAALDAREAPYPPLLLKTLSRFLTLVKSTPADIEPEHLHAATTLLRGQVESAAKPSASSNVPPLEDGELALAKSITMISDLVVMGTVRGKALFDDADRVSFDAGPDEKFIKLSKELFELVKTHGGIMEGAAVDLLLDVLISGNLAPHPKRFAFLQEGSAKNALFVFGAVGLLLIATPDVGALPFLADKLVDVGILIGGGYVLSKEARDKIDEFILQNENKLREIAKHKESLKWLDDVLYLREQHRKRQKDDLKK